MNIITIEDEVHFISMAIDAGDAAAKCGDQIVHRDKQHIGQYRTLDMTSQPLAVLSCSGSDSIAAAKTLGYEPGAS